MTNNNALIERMYFVPTGTEDKILEDIAAQLVAFVREAGYPLYIETSVVEDEFHNDLDLGAAGDVMVRLLPKNSETCVISGEPIVLPNATINVYRQRKRVQDDWREYKVSASIWTLGDSDNELVAREARDPFNSVDDAIRWSAEKLTALE